MAFSCGAGLRKPISWAPGWRPRARRGLSLHRRERGRSQQRVADVLHQLTVLLRFGGGRDPFGIGEKGAPALLALGKALPCEQVGELMVALADERRPEAC